MKQLKTSILLMTFMSIFVISCAQQKGTSITGKITGAENTTVFLEELALSAQGNTLTKAQVDASGNFTLAFPDGMKKGVYRLKIGEKVLDLVSDGTEKKIEVGGNLAEINDFKYTVKGSKLSELYLSTVTDYIASQDVPALKAKTMNDVDPMVGFMIASRLFTFNPQALDVHQAVSKRMTATYADHALTKEYTGIIGQMESQMKMETAAQKIQVGMPAPEISLPGPDGKVRKLSDYKGKLVLIDFWASWCGPCRAANPHVVEVYKKYNGKGFEVFSVSLDGVDPRQAGGMDAATLKQAEESSKQRWVGAIAQDGLLWDAHVSDLKKWASSPAGEYGVRSIPQTFLVGRDGKILAVNPRSDLEEQVSKSL